MANVLCLECGKNCGTEATLHRHLKAHKLPQAAYYQKHQPRYDRYDGSMIKFKSKEYYFSTDFNSRKNLHKWLDRVAPAEARAYITEYLLARKAKKSLTFVPTQVELRSLLVPGMVYLGKLFGNYNDFAKSLGFQPKFDLLKFSNTPRAFLPHHEIYRDTREQNPLDFHIGSVSQGLTFGDYRLNDDDFTKNVCIERKSMADFFGTLSSGFERFQREIQRAKDAGFYLVVVIENSMSSIETYIASLRGKGIYVSAEYVLHNMRTICQSFDNVQFLFVQDRSEATLAIERIFQSNGECKRVDLQYLYDKDDLIYVV